MVIFPSRLGESKSPFFVYEATYVMALFNSQLTFKGPRNLFNHEITHTK